MRILILPIVLVLSLFIGACDKVEDSKRPKVNPDEITEKIIDSVTTANEKAKQERDQFVLNVQEEMDELNIKFDEFKQRVENATGNTKEDLTQKMQDLEQERNEVKLKLKRIKSETSDKWDELKLVISEAIENLKQSIAKANNSNNNQ